jgi:hypothetical protein
MMKSSPLSNGKAVFARDNAQGQVATCQQIRSMIWTPLWDLSETLSAKQHPYHERDRPSPAAASKLSRRLTSPAARERHREQPTCTNLVRYFISLSFAFCNNQATLKMGHLLMTSLARKEVTWALARRYCKTFAVRFRTLLFPDINGTR